MGTAARVAVATGGSAAGNYSMIVFTGWDYGCLGDRATKLKQKNIHYRLQVRSGRADHPFGFISRLLSKETEDKENCELCILSKRIGWPWKRSTWLHVEMSKLIPSRAAYRKMEGSKGQKAISKIRTPPRTPQKNFS